MVADLKKDKLSNKSRGDIKLEVNWEYVKETSPLFKSLIMRLLKPPDSQPVETARTDEERQNEQ